MVGVEFSESVVAFVVGDVAAAAGRQTLLLAGTTHTGTLRGPLIQSNAQHDQSGRTDWHAVSWLHSVCTRGSRCTRCVGVVGGAP